MMRRSLNLLALAATLAVIAVASARAGNPPPQTCDAGESPDVIAGDIPSSTRWGNVDGITAYTFGVTACNPGTCWLNFIHNTSQHPITAHNMYRLKTVDGAARFEQIGISWLFHGFFALSNAVCFTDCQPTDGQHLGVHCSDTSSANITGQQSNLSPRSQVNPSTGSFSFPFTAPPQAATIGRRIQVHDSDLDPAANPGALYFVEAQYISSDDAAEGNGHNNASHRGITFGPSPPFNVIFNGAIQREQPAIHAWKASDPDVIESVIDVPGDGRFILSARATDLGGGFWHYEYALHNLNSHRAAMSFSVPRPSAAIVSNLEFHDVDYHSGEVFDLTDWDASAEAPAIVWSTQSFDENGNANALRWGTLYNFRFDANAAPVSGDVRVGLFRPGLPDEMVVSTITPAQGVPAAAVVSAVSRKATPSGGRGFCDLKLIPPPVSEPRNAGVTEVRIGFNAPPGAPSGSGVTIEESSCAAPAFVPYSGTSQVSSAVQGFDLVVTFSPGLENGRSYRMTLSSEVTAIGGQTVEVRGLLGDVTSDGLTDGVDRSVLVGIWTGSGFSCESDVNLDGVTNAGDRSVVVGAWTGSQNCAP